ncbi:unnamed protein product [Brassica rapa]|uniref:Uncharacterized protein n=2 Tax=Brassica TaxID=3705 RepID=A0A3P6B5U1_BRACM|nr:unnamed protein product [Brassica napus]CAG7900821.1 unnamed protein product [Brassica rapa]VDC95813.1 unnamed protein product [Brassica rapa]
MVSKDIGNTPVPSLLRGYAKVELLTIAELNEFVIISKPQVVQLVFTTDMKMEKGWCCVSCVHKETPTSGLILFI